MQERDYMLEICGDPSEYSSEEEYIESVFDGVYDVDFYRSKKFPGMCVVDLCVAKGGPNGYLRFYFDCEDAFDMWTDTLDHIEYEFSGRPFLSIPEGVEAEEIYNRFAGIIESCAVEYSSKRAA